MVLETVSTVYKSFLEHSETRWIFIHRILRFESCTTVLGTEITFLIFQKIVEKLMKYRNSKLSIFRNLFLN